MNAQTTEDEVADLRGRVHSLELEVRALTAQARIVRFIGGAVIVAVIGLVVNALAGVVV